MKRMASFTTGDFVRARKNETSFRGREICATEDGTLPSLFPFLRPTSLKPPLLVYTY